MNLTQEKFDDLVALEDKFSDEDKIFFKKMLALLGFLSKDIKIDLNRSTEDILTLYFEQEDINIDMEFLAGTIRKSIEYDFNMIWHQYKDLKNN